MLHKKISSSSFELVSVQSKMGVMDFFCLNKKSSNASLKFHFKFVFLISSIFTLDLLQISICVSCKGFPSHNEKKAHTHTLPLTRFPYLNKSNVSEGNLIETLHGLSV
ncbi:hypothetical protein XENOCAPTIV_002478 [Xenoophorus captivus]|uniref:Uncharacterized protein n=1 Tax=Xenoophorus captivus TaxID=1517983 RepID=A0ABV0S1D0_9TELE